MTNLACVGEIATFCSNRLATRSLWQDDYEGNNALERDFDCNLLGYSQSLHGLIAK